MTEDYMVGWHHHLDEHEFEQAPGVGDGQEGLAYCNTRGHKELNMTERLHRILHMHFTNTLLLTLKII